MKYFVLMILFTVDLVNIKAQNILLDKPVLADELTLFPDISNPNQYYFVPNKIRIGQKPNGTPDFSFIRYVENVRSEEGEESIREGNGGGIVHALVELFVTDDQKQNALLELRKITKNPNATIMGPTIYKRGTLALISSIANKDGGMSKLLLGLGDAPLLIGNKAAVSILLTKQGAKILWETFKTPTPDMSFSFVMNLSGYRTPLNAKAEVNFDNIYKSETFNLGFKSSFFEADLRLGFEEMIKNGAIKISGPAMDEEGEKILNLVMGKLIDQMFEPVNPGSMNDLDVSLPENSTQNPSNSDIQKNNSSSQKDASSNAGIKMSMAYQLKKIRKTGNFVLDLNRSLSDEISIRFDENLGQINCLDCFRQVNLDDPMLRQREIQVSLDGLNADQFKKYINFATISLRKTHGNKDITTDEVIVGFNDFDKKGNVFRLLYGWKDTKDSDKDKWLKYEYKITWSLFGDYMIEGEWKPSDAFGINAAPPVRPVTIDIEASPEVLKTDQVRSANIKFFYNYGGGEKVEQVNIRTESSNTAAKVELLLLQNQYDYEYEIIWRLTGNREVKSGRLRSNSTLLYADELPN